MSSKRILHVTSELSPYFEENPISTAVNRLAVRTYLAGNDVRVFMPKFGFINERRFQLHEVIRLSGINLIINDLDQPLVIKVASLPGERMQVYFVDNDEYFKRKTIYQEENGTLHEDNHERAIFFVKGVIETIKKLNWVPDVIHVHGWMAAFLPVYLKTFYANDAIFNDSSLITSLYNHLNSKSLSEEVFEVLEFDGIKNENLTYFTTSEIENLIKECVHCSDLVIKGEEFLSDELEQFLHDSSQEQFDYKPIDELTSDYINYIKEGVNVNL